MQRKPIEEKVEALKSKMADHTTSNADRLEIADLLKEDITIVATQLDSYLERLDDLIHKMEYR